MAPLVSLLPVFFIFRLARLCTLLKSNKQKLRLFVINDAKSEVGKHGFVVKFFLRYEKLILVGKVTV